MYRQPGVMRSSCDHSCSIVPLGRTVPSSRRVIHLEFAAVFPASAINCEARVTMRS